MVQNENFIMQRGWRKIFDCLFKFWTLPYGPKAVVEFSKGQIDRIFPRSVLRPLYVYLSFGIFHIQ